MILDTNALSAVAEAEPAAVAALQSARIVAIPVIVLGEYRYGISLSRHSTEYESWLGKNLPFCRVLDITAATAAEYARIRVELRRAGTPIPSNDSWIAALSRQYNFPLLSRDGHFDMVKGVQRLSW